MKFQFPKDFQWGFSSSAYQIEGGVDKGEKGSSIWDTFSHAPGNVTNGDTGDIACDHYHRYKEDLQIIADLGSDVYHFSTAWTRIQPNGKGRAQQEGIDFYNRLVDSTLELGLKPWLTLFHWDLPQALQDEGGWTNRDTADYFVDYADILFRALGDRIPMWLTHNEPWVASYLGYGMGIHAPGIKDYKQAVAAAHCIMLSHGKTVQAFRASDAQGKVGINPNFYPVHPATEEQKDIEAAELLFENCNTWFLDALFKGSYPQKLWNYYEQRDMAPEIQEGDMDCIRSPIDFMGINYYSRHVAREKKGEVLDVEIVPQEDARQTAMGWEVYSDGLYEILMHIHKEYPPIDLYITENGAAYDDQVDAAGHVHDAERVRFFQEHFAAAHRAMEAGVRLKGYLVWSFMDNFEWSFGYTKRFGLIYVDYGTQKRILKDSAKFFKTVAESNGFEPPADAR